MRLAELGLEVGDKIVVELDVVATSTTKDALHNDYAKERFIRAFDPMSGTVQNLNLDAGRSDNHISVKRKPWTPKPGDQVFVCTVAFDDAEPTGYVIGPSPTEPDKWYVTITGLSDKAYPFKISELQPVKQRRDGS